MRSAFHLFNTGRIGGIARLGRKCLGEMVARLVRLFRGQINQPKIIVSP